MCSYYSASYLINVGDMTVNLEKQVLASPGHYNK